jgi:hypothetical protein
MKTIKKLAINIMAIVVCALMMVAPIKAQNLFIRADYVFAPLKTSSLSEDFRNVPIYKDDGVGFCQISQSSYNLSHSWGAGLRYMYQFKSHASIGFGVMSYWLMGGNIADKKYNDEGASVFCETDIYGPFSSLGVTKPLFRKISLVPELIIEAPLGRFNDGYPKLAITISYEALMAINGWERKGGLEYNDAKVLAHVFPIDIGFKFGCHHRSIEAGARLFVMSKTSLGKKSNIETSTCGFYIAVSTDGY